MNRTTNQTQDLNQNLLQHNINYTILSMSVPIPNKNKSGYKISIATSFTTTNFELGKKEILERMHYLNINRFRIFLITKEQNEIWNAKFNNPHFNSNYLLTILNTEKFFTLNCMEYLFNDQRENSFEYIFVFKGIPWINICAHFIMISIDISSGSNNKKYLLSPLQLKLSLFIACLNDASQSFTDIVSSFHRYFREEDKKSNDYTNKDFQKKLIDLAASNAIFKKRILGDINLKFPSSDSEYINNSKIPSNLSSTSENNIKEETNLNITNKGDIKNKVKNENRNLLLNQSKSPNRKYHTSLFSIKKIRQREMSTVSTNKSSSSLLNNSVLGSYFYSMKEIIDGTIEGDKNKKIEAQQILENNWIDLIKEKLKDDKFFINRHQDKVLSSLKNCQFSLDIMEENNYFKKRFPTLAKQGLEKKLNNFDNIVLTFSICLSLHSRISYNSLAVKIGNEIIYNLWKKEVKCKENDALNFIEWKKLVEMNTIQILKLGDFFMTLLYTFPSDLFQKNVKLDSYYTNEPFYLIINKDYLEEIKKNIIINPMTLPMISPPKLWSDKDYGGYISNDSREIDIITGMNEYHHKIENKSSIYQSVNYLNQIEFSVNTTLLDYITSEDGKYILEEIKPDDDLQRTIILEVAKLYSKVPFYLNTHADWRGRIYTQSFFLSYQSGDLSSSLLNFLNGEKLTNEGKFYLYIYGANSHDQNKISKASFKDRISWVNKNYDKIVNLNKELILSAQSPFIFTAFCLNMRELDNNPNAIIKTPVFLDATCSGIQHLAALMKDLELGANTNLISSKMEDKPEDIYETLLEPINNAINEFGEENVEYPMLSLVKLTRKEVKIPIMTKVYNVTKYGISNQLQSIFKMNNEEDFANEFYHKPLYEIQKDTLDSFKSNKNNTKYYCLAKDGKKIELSKRDIYKIASVINEQIFVVFPSLNIIYNYFIELAKLAVKLELPLTWITPSGLKITQNYLKQKKKVISISIFGKTKKIVMKENIDKLDKGKQVQSIIPNIIHSLDASHLMNIIKNATIDNFNPVITIHDCFGTLPNKMGSLEYKVKKEFILLYSDNQFLHDYHNRFLQNLKDNQFEIQIVDKKHFVLLEDQLLEIPSLPQLGKLDLENIKNSKYMIS